MNGPDDKTAPPPDGPSSPAGDAAEDTTPIVEVEGLVASYGGQRVLNGIDMRVEPRQVMVILGGSGSGKSTLLKCLLGIHRPDAGCVRVLGTDVWAASRAEREAIYKQIGIVFQSGALFSSLSVNQNVGLALREHTGLDEKIVNISVRMKLGLVGLAGFGERKPAELSGGQRKRVAFARAIAMDPPLVFCDEPSAGLDPRIGRGIDDLIRILNRAFGTAFVVVTHEMESVKVIADRILMLVPRAGGAKVVFSGTHEEMQACEEPDVRDFVNREPLKEPRAEAREVLRQLVGEEP